MKEYTIHPLPVGINQTDQGIMTYQRYYGRRIWLPIYSFLIKGGDLKILVDTGLEEFMVPAGAEEQCGFEILEFEAALDGFGLIPNDIDIIIHTHLHNDHCENDYKCKKAKVYVQKTEFDFFKNPHPIDHRYFPELLDGVDIEVIEGDKKLLDGIGLYLTPGHTPGGQSVAVNTSRGLAVITGFCCNGLNFPKDGPIIPSGVHINAIEAYESAKKIKEMADIIIPLHDVEVGKMKSIPAVQEASGD